MNIKLQREQKEFQTIFRNPKHARTSWQENVYSRFCRTAVEPILLYDKDGNILPQSQIELAVWNQLKSELEEQGISRNPTDGEMMEACQAYYSRHNSASYVARRDSMGAKPIDESKQTHVVNNPLESLSDEELLVIEKALAAHREALAEPADASVDVNLADAEPQSHRVVEPTQTNQNCTHEGHTVGENLANHEVSH